MLKKSNNDLACSKEDPIKCSLCKCNSAKAILYCCESGHVVCENCRQSDGSEERQDGGDYVSDKKIVKHSRKSKRRYSLAASKNLASGDHDKCSHTLSVKLKSRSQSKVQVFEDVNDRNVRLSHDKKRSKEEILTIIEYKNENFYNGKSSSSSANSDCSRHESDVAESSENRVCPRPVTCPVQKCGKMLALDSVMLHFYFDHSKVPKVNIAGTFTGKLVLKLSCLNEDSQCLAVFLIQEKKDGFLQMDSSALQNGSSDYKSLLLMGARIQSEKTTTDKHNIAKKNGSTTISINQTGTDSTLSSGAFGSTEILLLWLCKLDENTNTFGITISNKDKKRSHKFVGEAIHIRNEQTATSIYQRADCLIVHGAAANKLLDEQNQVITIISILE